MTSPADLEQLVIDEFMTYYLADEAAFAELPFQELLLLWAGESAGRLYGRLRGHRIPELIALLRAAGNDAGHPLTADITAHSDIAWVDDEGKNTLTDQLTHIAVGLQAIQQELQARHG